MYGTNWNLFILELFVGFCVFVFTAAVIVHWVNRKDRAAAALNQLTQTEREKIIRLEAEALKVADVRVYARTLDRLAEPCEPGPGITPAYHVGGQDATRRCVEGLWRIVGEDPEPRLAQDRVGNGMRFHRYDQLRKELGG